MVAVIGANGFLGSRLTYFLLQKNKKVIAVHNGNTSSIDSRATLIKTDSFLDSDLNPTEIYFSAGSYSCSHQELLQINDLLYEISKKFITSKIIFISSTNVYGMHKDVISINSSFNDPGLYAISKIAGEFIVRSHEKYAILRLTYLYGPGLNNKSFLPNLIANSKEKGEITLFGDGKRFQDYLYIDDAISLCMACESLKTNETLVGATGISISNKEVASIISSFNQCQINYTGVETSQSFRFDIEHTLNKVNWSPKISFKEGLNNVLTS